MQTLHLDASTWRTPDDVYNALLAALGAPAWHGRNLDALNDSLTDGNLNAVNPPLRVEVRGLPAAGPDAQALVRRIADLFAELSRDGPAVEWRAV